ncbi:MAG: hypothetical protein JWR38_4353 [Mucilaginibacter sp.]|nr:hypothetical protein [Mucilaginibacter sp.]
MTLQFMATLMGLLNDRQMLQRIIWKQHSYSPQNKYNQCCAQLEGLLDEMLELIDDHEYRSVLNVSFEEWSFLKSEK